MVVGLEEFVVRTPEPLPELSATRSSNSGSDDLALVASVVADDAYEVGCGACEYAEAALDEACSDEGSSSGYGWKADDSSVYESAASSWGADEAGEARGCGCYG